MVSEIELRKVLIGLFKWLAIGIVILAVIMIFWRLQHPLSGYFDRSDISKTVKLQSAFRPATHNATQTAPAAGPTPQNNAKAVAYLNIKEWGVRLPLPADIKDAYYIVSVSSSKDPDGLPSTVWLGQRSLSKPTCNPANNNVGKRGALGALLRIPPTANDAVTGEPLTQKYPDGVTINGYYYAYQSWKNDNPCASVTSLGASDSAFATAVKNSAVNSTN